jgi:hypothetical protein
MLEVLDELRALEHVAAVHLQDENVQRQDEVNAFCDAKNANQAELRKATRTVLPH